MTSMKARMTRSSRPSLPFTGLPFGSAAPVAATASAGMGCVPCREGDQPAGRQLYGEPRALSEGEAAHRVDREVGDELRAAQRLAAEARAPERAEELHLADGDLDEAAVAGCGAAAGGMWDDVLRPDGHHDGLSGPQAVGHRLQ